MTVAEADDNRDVILRALRRIGAKSVAVDYDGGGDSGQIGEVVIELKSSVDHMSESIKVQVTKVSNRFDGNGWVNEEKMSEESLEEAIKELCYEFLEGQHPGWEINEGSHGQFDFDVETGGIKLVHNQNYIKTETTEHEF